MKVCLIRPPIVVPAQNIMALFTPPIGIAYVAGTLIEHGYQVDVIDGLGLSLDTRHVWDNDTFLYGLNLQQVVDRIPENAKVVGVHCGFSFDWPACRSLITMIRAKFPDAILIGGGEHVNALPEDSLRTSSLNYLVLGEGEETMLELCATLNDGITNLNDLKGIAFIDQFDRYVRTEPRARLRDIDSILPPAWDLVPLTEYLDRGFGYGVDRGRSMPILGSRGCPYQCTFCSNPSMWTTRWVARDVDMLLDEMENYIEKYNVTNFDFYDLTFVLKKQWVLDFCKKIVDRGLNITWQLPAGTRSEVIDKEVAAAMYSSGCRNMTYAPESGSPTTLKRIKKKISTDSVVKSIHECVGEGVNCKVNLIFGFPGETIKEIIETHKFISRVALAGAHDLSIWGFSPYPGSELFNDMVSEGRLEINEEYYDSLRTYSDVSNTTSYCENLTNFQLKCFRISGRVVFYSISWMVRPVRPFRIIFNALLGRHESRMDMGLANAYRRMWFYPKL